MGTRTYAPVRPLPVRIEGRRLFVVGRRVHHGTIGGVVAATGVVFDVTALVVVGALLMAHDWHDWDCWVPDLLAHPGASRQRKDAA